MMLDSSTPAVGASIQGKHQPERRSRQVLSLDDFTEADIEALEKTRAPESSKAYDDEVEP